MASSSENLASIVDPWALRTTIHDSWIFDTFSRETETLTRALQRSLAGVPSYYNDPFLDLIKPEPTPTPTPTVSGLETDTPPKRQIPTAGGKITKRKSRASKKNHTTFITADPANFRQMVQQVTGVRFGNSQVVEMAPVLKPEAQRPGSRLNVGSCLPTLDTSAFLLNSTTGSGSGSGSEITGPGPLTFRQGNGGAIGSDFESFSSFPTLESWKVMS